MEELIKTKGSLELPEFPCHTQNVERMVKIVTEVSLTACSEEARDGIIRTKLKSRKDIPRFETKKDFIQSATNFE